MDFWGHLDALRGVLFKIAIAIVTVAVVLFIYMPWIFDHVILAPCDGNFISYRLLGAIQGDGMLLPDLSGDGFHVDLVNFQLTAQFNTHIALSVWGAFVLCFPFVIYELWTFVAPGLYPHERRNARPAFLFGNVMFILGILCSYFIVFPMCLRFLAGYQLSEAITNTISLSSYIDNFFTLTLIMGITFELPLLCWMLGKMGILKRNFFTRFRRHAIVVILIAAAIITPTGDPVTLFVMFVPLYALWELSALVVPKNSESDNNEA